MPPVMAYQPSVSLLQRLTHLKVETTLPSEKEARILQYTGYRMKALQAFHGVYSGLLTTILTTDKQNGKTISLTAYLFIPLYLTKVTIKDYQCTDGSTDTSK